MALAVNTNNSSLNAQRNLSTSQASLNTSLQRLSSGLRINSAKDDAAGLAISERFTTQIRGNDQAQRNANDGISLAQTAEGDLEQIGNNLQRIRELAVQSSNASNSASDRLSIDNESKQLIAEIDRVSGNSSFNGHKLLDGTFTAQSFQIGANNTSNDRIKIDSIASATSSSLGVGSGSSFSTKVTGATAVTAGLASGDLAINGFNVGPATADGVSVAAAINAISGESGVTATVGKTTVTGVAGAATAVLANDLKINGVDIGAISATTGAVDRGSQTAAAINAKASQTGVTATFDSAGKVSLATADGRNIQIEATANGFTGTGLGVSAATTTTRSSITLSSANAAGITLGGNTGAVAAGFTAGTTAAVASAGTSVASLDLTTATGAQAALATLDSAINTVNTTRGALGAYQNRFESTVASLQTTTENLSASRGRIRDADFAKESANLSRAQVLQQAGTAILSQANQSAQGVLSLLR